MINLPVDEAYALDYLAILEVKVIKCPDDEGKKSAFKECARVLLNQLGDVIFWQIMYSHEYAKLLAANIHTFECVDKARKNEKISAKEVDDANMERYYCKQALQKKFFHNDMVESKIV